MRRMNFPPNASTRKAQRALMAGAMAFIGGCASLPDGPEQIALPYVKLFSDNEPGVKLPTGWQPWTLSRFKKSTEYKLIDTEGRTAVHDLVTAGAHPALRHGRE